MTIFHAPLPLEAKSATDGYVTANIEHLMLWLLNGPMLAKGAHEE